MITNLQGRIWILTGTVIVIMAVGLEYSQDELPEYAISLGGKSADLYAPDGHPLRSMSAQYKVHIKNTGTSSFRLLGASSSCSCTVLGNVSPSEVPQGGSGEVPIEVHFPPYGRKTTRLTVFTDAPGIEATNLTLNLHGPEISVPFFASSARPIQLLTTIPSEYVNHDFTIDAFEPLDETPWLKGIQVSNGYATVESTGIETIQEVSESNLCRRRYYFTLHMIGPDREDDVSVTKLSPETRSAHSPLWDSPSVRCTLSPEITFVSTK